jgi:LPS-assembly protein
LKAVALGRVLAACLALLIGWHEQAAGQTPVERGIDRTAPVLFRADSVQHDRDLGTVVATGNVEITQSERTLLADSVTYNQRTDRMSAAGNVSLLEPTGEVVFADFMELSGDLKDGVAEAIRIRMVDDALFAAASGTRTGGTRTEMHKAVYSPCALCEDKPDRAPVWQVKAYRVVHDQNTKNIEYQDAFLELFGVPVVYTPYLSHPDPTVERRSGFLMPAYGSSSELGPFVRVPYYHSFSPTEDLTFSPTLTWNEGPVLAGEYRNRFNSGLFGGRGSITYASKDDNEKGLRGHLDANLRYDINDTWRAGFLPSIASDDTYLRRYGLSSLETLTSRVFAEGFRGRNYAAANAYYFQGLRAGDDPGATPIIFPLLDYNFVGQPGWAGSRLSVDANLMGLTRTDGTDSRRLSFKPGWELPFTTSNGQLLRVHASVQADGYLVDQVADPTAPGVAQSGATGRVFPQAGADWRYPFVRSGETASQIVEPIVGFVVAPNGGNPDLIPNEDSLDFELDDTNIFKPSRFAGLDRVEGGQRVYYGVNAGVYERGGASATMFLGQSLRSREDATFPEGSGLRDELSDIVGRVRLAPARYLNLLYRFRLDKDGLEPRRNEVTTTIGPRALRLGATYTFIDHADDSEFPDREEVSVSLASQLTQRWLAAVGTRRDLAENGGTLNHSARIAYADDCFGIQADYVRTFTQDRDVRPSETILFRVILKTLGAIHTRMEP